MTLQDGAGQGTKSREQSRHGPRRATSLPPRPAVAPPSRASLAFDGVSGVGEAAAGPERPARDILCPHEASPRWKLREEKQETRASSSAKAPWRR